MSIRATSTSRSVRTRGSAERPNGTQAPGRKCRVVRRQSDMSSNARARPRARRNVLKQSLRALSCRRAAAARPPPWRGSSAWAHLSGCVGKLVRAAGHRDPAGPSTSNATTAAFGVYP
eukprot:365968-Chlamydomonas_euryale.AAC.6